MNIHSQIQNGYTCLKARMLQLGTKERAGVNQGKEKKPRMKGKSRLQVDDRCGKGTNLAVTLWEEGKWCRKHLEG